MPIHSVASGSPLASHIYMNQSRKRIEFDHARPYRTGAGKRRKLTMQLETIHWHTVAPKYLGPDSKVLDLGANYGMFARAITQRFGCKCVAVEPSPEPFKSITPTADICTLQIAIADRPGTMNFRISENSLASSLDECGSIAVEVDSLPNLITKLGWDRVDLLKVDIEGAEIGMLSACADDFLSNKIAQISIEFHDFCGITRPETVHDTISRLNEIGFVSIRMSRVGHQDTLLLNTLLLPHISKFDIAIARYVTRNWFGLKRVVGRIIPLKK
jgi:FkbM family methyltransferase